MLREARADYLAEALCELASSPVLRRRLSAAGLAAVRARTWERSLEQLADGYRRALAPQTAEQALEPAAA
jgi:glycosyltransferase involved in cell wall biosynthesis